MTANQMLVVYEQNEATLIAAAQACQGLKINGIDDRKGYGLVRSKRLELRDLRIQIENQRKDLKADALKFGQKVDAEARRLTALVEPTELALKAEEDRIDNEREAIRVAEENARKRRLDDRVAAFQGYLYPITASALEAMSDEEYESTLVAAKQLHEERMERERIEAERVAKEKAEQDRIAAEKQRADAEAREQEARKLAAERIEMDRQKREHALEQAKLAEQQRIEREAIAAERKKLDDERAAIERAKAPPIVVPKQVAVETISVKEERAINAARAWRLKSADRTDRDEMTFGLGYLAALNDVSKN